MKATGAPDNGQRMAQSYVGWLLDAGADFVVEEASVNWLGDENTNIDDATLAVDIDAAGAEKPTKKAAPIAPGNIPKPSENITPKSDWPADLQTLHQSIAQGAPLPGTKYGGKALAPIGDAKARYMLIFDLPDAQEIKNGKLLSSSYGALTHNMMKAANIADDDQYITALSLTRPATGDLPEGDIEQLTAFLRHQIELVSPEFMILFGSSACSALLGAELMKTRGNLHYFNHNDQNVATLTTFHPRTLLVRPQLKAQAWRDLLVLQ